MAPNVEPPDPPPGAWDVNALWSRVRARTLDAAREGAERSTPAHAASPVRPSRRLAGAWPVAAAMLLVTMGAGALFVRSRQRPDQSVPEPAPGRYSTGRGQDATIRLSDGSEVTLGPESRLTISARFAQGARDISLDGEAIFIVRHDGAHPFRVRARGALIQDIGTRFDLRAYPDEPVVTVAVAEGSVSLRHERAGRAEALGDDTASVVLQRSDVGTLDGRGDLSAERSSRVSSYFGWASGRLSFVDRPLPEVLRTIGRWYDLDVRAPDARLARRLVNAEFSSQAPAEMLDALAIAMDATVERSGRIIILRPR
jgi:ferric-dicitrate binding protein FerR (iron transport regulator)